MNEIEMNPPLWANSGHLQTLLGYLIPSVEPQLGKKQIFTLKDGDQIDFISHNYSSDFVYVFFHGLSGSYLSSYMKRAVHYCDLHKKTYYIFNHRGAGEIKTKKNYHSGVAPDASEMIDYVRMNNPGKKIIATGYSMSANILLLLNGKFSDLPQADFYISVNAPIDLGLCSQRLSEGFNRIYDWNFVRDLRNKLNPEDKKKTVGVNIYDFDEIYTAPRCGFLNREDYYKQCSSLNWVGKIQRPHYVLTAKDDPFIPFDSYRKAKWNQKALVEYTTCGGHLGYLTQDKTKPFGWRWLDAFLDEKFKRIEGGDSI